MSSEKKIILHVGLPKTGTTTVQNVLHANRETLLRNGGLLYPALSPNLTNALCTMFLDDPLKHITNRMEGLTREQAFKKGREYSEALSEEISRTRWDVLLLSAEGLSNLQASDLSKLRSWISGFAENVEVHVCVRHPISYTRSVIQEIMKGGRTLSEMEKELPLPNYRGKITNFIKVFGRESIRVFDFESLVIDVNGLAHAFALRLGMRPEIAACLTRPGRSDNESMSMEAVILLDSMNRNVPVFLEGAPNPGRTSHALVSLLAVRGRKFSLRDEVQLRIIESCADDIAWLNEEFGLNLYEEVVKKNQQQTCEASPDKFFTFSPEAVDDIASIIAKK